MVVFSFSISTFFALPSISSVTFSSLMPRSSLITWPSVSTAISSSIALRRSPKPGALTAATFNPPRSLLTTSVASASPSTSSATTSSGRVRLRHRLQQRQQSLQSGELLLVDQDVGLLQLDVHLLGVGDEIRRHVAAVELHALDDVEFGQNALGFLDRDDAFVADLLHRLGNHLADFGLAIGRDRADLRRLGLRGNLLAALLQFFDQRDNRLVDAALQVHRVHASGHRFATLAHDGLCEDDRSGGAVAGDVVGLRGGLAHHLRAHVLKLIGEFDLLGDRHAILGDARRTIAFVQDHVATLRAERDLHRRGKYIDTTQHALTGIVAEPNVFRSHLCDPS